MAFLTETKVTRRPSKSVTRKLMIAVRIRPLKPGEAGRILHRLNDKVVVLEENAADKNDVLRQNRGSERQYTFDAVFGENSTQEMIFEKTTKGLVKDVLQGYNSTIFAYGASGSGKTYTMLGTNSEPGIMVRALHEIFGFVRNSNLPQNFQVTMSYLEIYNENIRDLLNPDSGFLELREDHKDKVVHVVKLTEVSTNSTEEMIRLLQKGNRARTMEPTALNKTSSRSHALLSINVRQTFPLEKNEKLKARVKMGKLFMIDLAGSERAAQTKNRGKRLVEGAHINRSLLALGNCINALSGGARYVNYRDSKLTRLLKDALSGNSQTCMIAHVSPATIHREESKNTLLYAERAKSISNKVEKNVLDISYHVSQYRTIISELRDEIERLKSKMPEEKSIAAGDQSRSLFDPRPPSPPPKIKRSREDDEDPEDHATAKKVPESQSSPDRLSDLKNEIVATFKEQMKLRKRLYRIDSYLTALDAEADRQHAAISEWEGKYNRLYYRGNSYPGKMPEKPDLESLDIDYQEIERESKTKTLERALLEMNLIEREQEKYSELRAITESELNKCKQKAELLEKELPFEITSEEEKELLSLIVRVHELEVDKIVLQSERLMKENALRQKDLTIMRYDRQRQICEEIITRQRQIMEDGKIELPTDLLELYRKYQREIHAESYPESRGRKLPPIADDKRAFRDRTKSQNSEIESDQSPRTPSSSPASDWEASPLPPISGERFRYSSSAAPAALGTPAPGLPNAAASPDLPPPSVLFPPIMRLRQDSG